jgi:hypothetical protein
MSRVVRIQDDALNIAMQFGPSVSEGIRVMHTLLLRQKRCSFDPEAIRPVFREELERIGGY